MNLIFLAFPLKFTYVNSTLLEYNQALHYG